MYGSEQTIAMARELLERGADPNAINRMGNVPLSEAVVNNKIEFVKLLLEFGVWFLFRLQLGFCILIYAGQVSVVDLHHIDVDPDSNYHPDADLDVNPDSDFLFDADPDQTFHPDADPDPDPSFRKSVT
jgi:ankyrin repeat protein